MKPTLLLGSALLPCFAAWSGVPPPAMPLEESCSQVELIVIGTLGDLVEEKVPGGDPQAGRGAWKIGRIAIQEVLYGRPPEGGPKVWAWEVFPPGQPRPCGSGSPCEGKEGQAWIWCLNRPRGGSVWAAPPGLWIVDHPQKVIAPDRKGEVEKAIQARLAPDRKVLEEATDASPYHGLTCRGEESRQGASVLMRGQQAGPAALPTLHALLRHGKPVPRWLGCLLVSCMLNSGRFSREAETGLVEALAPLLEDTREVGVPGAQVDGMALQALRDLARGTLLPGKEEAKAWAAAREGALTPSPGSP